MWGSCCVFHGVRTAPILPGSARDQQEDHAHANRGKSTRYRPAKPRGWRAPQRGRLAAGGGWRWRTRARYERSRRPCRSLSGNTRRRYGGSKRFDLAQGQPLGHALAPADGIAVQSARTDGLEKLLGSERAGGLVAFTADVPGRMLLTHDRLFPCQWLSLTMPRCTCGDGYQWLRPEVGVLCLSRTARRSSAMRNTTQISSR